VELVEHDGDVRRDTRRLTAVSLLVVRRRQDGAPVAFWMEYGWDGPRDGTRELDTAAVVRARLYVDRRESALAESGDILIPIEEEAIDENHIVGELGDVLLRRTPGRTSAREVTLFKSLGIAIEDLAAAHHVLHKANVENAGVLAPLGAMHDAPA